MLYKNRNSYYNVELDKNGEQMSCLYLLINNYYILNRNFNTYYGEIDIIARDMNKEEYVFIEVKSRTTNNYGRPSDAINDIKIERIIKSSKYYIYLNNLWNKKIRYDVIEVYIKGKEYYINHIKNILL